MVTHNTTDVEKLVDSKKADMIFTDHPYNVDYEETAEKIKNDKIEDNNLSGKSVVFS